MQTKRGIILILALIQLITIVSASPILEIQNNDSIQPHETILGRIYFPENSSEEFTNTLSKSDITLYEGRKQVFIEKEITNYNGQYYFYIIVNKEGNFTIKVQNILYKDTSTNQIKTIPLEKSIQVKEELIEEDDYDETNKTYTQILSIKPGFIYTTSSVDLTLTNYGTKEINISYGEVIDEGSGGFFGFFSKEPEYENTITVEPEQSQKIKITPNQTDFSYTFLSTYKDFSIPTISLNFKNNSIIQPNPTKEIRTLPEYLHINIANLNQTEKSIEIFNFAYEEISNISASTNQNINISALEEDNFNIEARKSKNLSIIISPTREGYFEDKLTLSYFYENQSKTTEVTIYVYVFPENTKQEEMVVSNSSCSSLGGQVCTGEQFCSTEDTTFTSLGEYCCMGECKDSDDEGEGSFLWLIGIGILVLLGVGGYFIFKKFKKTKPKTSKETLEDSSEKFIKRISGSLER